MIAFEVYLCGKQTHYSQNYCNKEKLCVCNLIKCKSIIAFKVAQLRKADNFTFGRELFPGSNFEINNRFNRNYTL